MQTQPLPLDNRQSDEKKLKAERLAKSSLILNYLLDTNNLVHSASNASGNSCKKSSMHESKSCGNVVKEDDLLLDNDNDNDNEISKGGLAFDDKQLVTEEQFNQAFILNVSSLLIKITFFLHTISPFLSKFTKQINWNIGYLKNKKEFSLKNKLLLLNNLVIKILYLLLV